MALFLKSLKANGHLDSLHMTIISVGSRKLGQGDDFGSQAWNLFSPRLTIYGFDADADACEAANADLEARQIPWIETHIPLALSDSTGAETLYVTKHPMCSSLYPPNEPFLARFAGLSELVDLDFSIEFETSTLDTFCQEEGIHAVDFLQMDVQGAELKVLDGASHLLKEGGVLAIQTEVAFSPIYENQPLFADVDIYLRNQGFSFFDFEFRGTPWVRRRHASVYSNAHPGQLLWGDAIYFRDLLDEQNQLLRTPEQILKLACIADILGFVDYAAELLAYLTREYGQQDSKYNYTDCLT